MSPTVFRDGSFRYYFFSREEPRKHVHVLSPDGEAKFWLEPEVSVVSTKGLSGQALRCCLETVGERREEIIDAWNRHFSG